MLANESANVANANIVYERSFFHFSVPLDYMCLWTSCVFGLHVSLDYMCLWTTCVSGLHVLHYLSHSKYPFQLQRVLPAPAGDRFEAAGQLRDRCAV